MIMEIMIITIQKWESDTTPKPAKRNVRIDDILEATLEHDEFSTGTESDAPNSPRSGSSKVSRFL